MKIDIGKGKQEKNSNVLLCIFPQRDLQEMKT